MAYLLRYREICLQGNSRYLAALAQVDDPTPALRGLDTITVAKTPAHGRPVEAHAVSQSTSSPTAHVIDTQLFGALMSGEHALHGFTNRDVRAKLRTTQVPLSDNPRPRAPG